MPNKVEIYLLRGRGQLLEAYPAAGDSVLGFYGASADITAAVALFRDSSGLEAQDVLFHEYAHHFMFQNFANAYPAWYIEGFAEFVSTVRFESGRIVIGRASEARATRLLDGSWLSLERLIDDAGAQHLDADDTDRFYAESWLFVHYLFNTPGRNEQLLRYVTQLRRGVAPSEAFQAGFGMTPAEMQQQLRDYMRRSAHELALTNPESAQHAEIAFSRLPASADDLLPLSTRIRRDSVSDEEAPQFMQRLREQIGAVPIDRFALLTLARAEARYGDPARCHELLAPTLQANPADVEALYVDALSYLREAAFADGEAKDTATHQARRLLARALRADEYYVPALYAYVGTYTGAAIDHDTSQSLLNVLLQAHTLAPQVAGISLMTAQLLIRERRIDEAKAILRAVAYDPHGEQNAQTARAMLQRLESMNPPTPVSPPAR